MPILLYAASQHTIQVPKVRLLRLRLRQIILLRLSLRLQLISLSFRTSLNILSFLFRLRLSDTRYFFSFLSRSFYISFHTIISQFSLLRSLRNGL